MFKTFPEFSKLTLADKAGYEARVQGYPPVGDIAFPILMTWWESIGAVKVAELNGNLVLSYWIPGDEEHSGLSLLGTNKVEESVCAIFDFLREQKKRPRLVNVSEFVVHSMQFPELFMLRADRADDEYLVSPAKFANLKSLPAYMRLRVRKFERKWGKHNIVVRRKSLQSLRHREHLLELADAWPKKGLNNLSQSDRNMLALAIAYGAHLGIQSLCLYIDGELQSFCLYFKPNKQHATIITARVNYAIPRIFDYMVHSLSAYLSDDGVTLFNLGPDGGSLMMRTLKIALKPDNFFRKYIIEPVGSPHIVWPLSRSRHYY